MSLWLIHIIFNHNMGEGSWVDYVDESEVLTPADEAHHINKHDFKIPFVCGCRNLGEALRRINEGAAMIRTKGEAGTGNVVEAVRHARCILDEIASLKHASEKEMKEYAKKERVPVELVANVSEYENLPVVADQRGSFSNF